MKVISFYKYIEMDCVKEFRNKLFAFCNEKGIKGRILVAKEGINGSVTCKEAVSEKFINFFKNDDKFKDMMFKTEESLGHSFKKMQVKLKKLILPFDYEVDLSLKGEYLSPTEFLKIYDSDGKLKEDVILIDNRNDYEFRVGRFKGALKPGVNIFRDFPKIVDRLRGQEEKKIIMYCTGGIRCEKSSAYMKQEGFKNVNQLHGGILAFGAEKPDTVWEGKCFVFDKRLLSSINTNEKKFADCEICLEICERYQDCKNPKCNQFVALCSKCFENNRGCCSKNCKISYETFLKKKMENMRGMSNKIALQ